MSPRVSSPDGLAVPEVESWMKNSRIPMKPGRIDEEAVQGFLPTAFQGVDSVLRVFAESEEVNLHPFCELFYEAIVTVRELLNCWSERSLPSVAVESLTERNRRMKELIDKEAEKAPIKLEGKVEKKGTQRGWVPRQLQVKLNFLTNLKANETKVVDLNNVQSVEDIHTGHSSEFKVNIFNSHPLHYRTDNDSLKQVWMGLFRFYGQKAAISRCVSRMTCTDRAKILVHAIHTPFNKLQGLIPGTVGKETEFLFAQTTRQEGMTEEDEGILPPDTSTPNAAGHDGKDEDDEGPSGGGQGEQEEGSEKLHLHFGLTERFKVLWPQTLGKPKRRELEIDMTPPRKLMLYKPAKGSSGAMEEYPHLIRYRQDLIDYRVEPQTFKLEITFVNNWNRKLVFADLASLLRCADLLQVFQQPPPHVCFTLLHLDVLHVIDRKDAPAFKSRSGGIGSSGPGSRGSIAPSDGAGMNSAASASLSVSEDTRSSTEVPPGSSPTSPRKPPPLPASPPPGVHHLLGSGSASDDSCNTLAVPTRDDSIVSRGTLLEPNDTLGEDDPASSGLFAGQLASLFTALKQVAPENSHVLWLEQASSALPNNKRGDLQRIMHLCYKLYHLDSTTTGVVCDCANKKQLNKCMLQLYRALLKVHGINDLVRFLKGSRDQTLKAWALRSVWGVLAVHPFIHNCTGELRDEGLEQQVDWGQPLAPFYHYVSLALGQRVLEEPAINVLFEILLDAVVFSNNTEIPQISVLSKTVARSELLPIIFHALTRASHDACEKSLSNFVLLLQARENYVPFLSRSGWQNWIFPLLIQNFGSQSPEKVKIFKLSLTLLVNLTYEYLNTFSNGSHTKDHSSGGTTATSPTSTTQAPTTGGMNRVTSFVGSAQLEGVSSPPLSPSSSNLEAELLGIDHRKNIMFSSLDKLIKMVGWNERVVSLANLLWMSLWSKIQFKGKEFTSFYDKSSGAYEKLYGLLNVLVEYLFFMPFEDENAVGPTSPGSTNPSPPPSNNNPSKSEKYATLKKPKFAAIGRSMHISKDGRYMDKDLMVKVVEVLEGLEVAKEQAAKEMLEKKAALNVKLMEQQGLQWHAFCSLVRDRMITLENNALTLDEAADTDKLPMLQELSAKLYEQQKLLKTGRSREDCDLVKVAFSPWFLSQVVASEKHTRELAYHFTVAP